MVADIHIGNNLYDALSYNQEKINAGFGNILEANRIFVPADGQFSEGDCMRDFERAMLPQVTTTHGIIHISLNPHPEDRRRPTGRHRTQVGLFGVGCRRQPCR